MENNSRYFENKDCEFYKCHNSDNKDFNCLFCYCPLYLIEDCGGNFSITEKGIKDCSLCLIPHNYSGYDYIMKKLIKK